MSKLDDIFDQYRDDCFLGKDAGLDKSINMLALSAVAHKQQIKDLMLEIVGDNQSLVMGESDDLIGNHIRNKLKDELRNKIEDL